MTKVREVVPRKIVANVPDNVLQSDLEKYRRRAIALGATDARIITADRVIIDERVLAKCLNPKCANYGTCMNCPPHAMSPELMRRVTAGFRYAIFTMMKVPAAEVAGPVALENGTNARSKKINHDMISEIESAAFFDGYYLATGFADASCKSLYCGKAECAALTPGQPCRFALRARSSMEAVGIDAFKMAAMEGWDVYPITASVRPENVPHAVKLGLVLIY
jgi:predicted metal-binding protein